MAKILAGSLGLIVATMGAMAYRDSTVGADGAGAPAAAPEGMRNEVFHFRKEKIKDDAGNEIEVFKHPSVTIPLPVVTRDDIVGIFTDESRTSEQSFVLGLVQDAFYAQARDQINEFREQNTKGTVSAEIIDYSKLTINALANMPASERGNKVSDEDMTAFIQDYVAIMPTALNKDASKIKAQAGILEKGLRTVRTDKKVLGVMEGVLAVWASATSNLDEHKNVYDMLMGRIKKWLDAEPKNVLDSIL